MKARGWLAILLICVATGAPARDELAVARRRLADARRDAVAAANRAADLDRAAGVERDAAAKALKQEAAFAARIDRAEADIAAARARIAIVADLLARQRTELGGRQQPVARLLAALQSMAGRPPVLAIVQPGSIDDVVHTRAVLASVMPVIAARTATVRADLARTRRLEADAALAARALRDGRVALVAERGRLATLRASHAARAGALGRDALAQSDQAIALGEQARDLIDQLEAIGGARTTLADLQALTGPPLFDQASQPPAVAAYRLPVAGRLVTGLGEVSDNGVRARGLTFVVAPGAPVVAPAGGRIAFARPFRGYGKVTIIDHGSGWTTLVTGLGTLAVKRGDRVRAGAPLGTAVGGGDPRVTIELRRRGAPVDIAALVG